jgi:acyl-CoA reductase-like NAD-dependent aldehyde dehydrogenase/uncharacterized protein (DUF2141 family)
LNASGSAIARMEKARRAQIHWASLSVDRRCRALRPLRHAIAANIDRIVAVISEEVGKPPLDALTGDLLVTLEQFHFYERNAPRILRSRSTGKPPFFFPGMRFIESLEPRGVVLIFSPWNYPFQLAVIPMATALFAGNAVMLKCSERTPRTAALIASLCSQAVLPDGLVQVSREPPQEAAALIDAHPDFLFFTGSSGNGRMVAQQAAGHLIPTVLELGGKDPCLIFASCDLTRAVEGAVFAAFSNAGQVCVGAKRIYVEQPIYQDFLHRFLARAAGLRIGTTLDSDMGPVRSSFVRQLLSRQIDDAIARGATLHTMWQRDSESLPPLVLTGVAPQSLLLTEESFGPVVSIAPFHDETQAIQLANSTPFALSAGIFTGNFTQGQHVAAQLKSGACTVNDVIRNIGNPHASFGGNHASGYGRYHGPTGLHTFSRSKTVMTSTRFRNPEIHWFPFTPRTFHRLRDLLLFRHAGGSLPKRMKNLFHLFILTVFLCTYALAQAGSSSPLSLVVTLPPGNRGVSIAYLVFSSPGGFPNSVDKSLRHGFIPIKPIKGRRQQIDLGSLAPGRYAVVVYLDLNGNRKLDKGFLGIPKEPVGASNNPKGRIGPPHFDECSSSTDRSLRSFPSPS